MPLPSESVINSLLNNGASSTVSRFSASPEGLKNTLPQENKSLITEAKAACQATSHRACSEKRLR
jgi:hypothetical protein